MKFTSTFLAVLFALSVCSGAMAQIPVSGNATPAWDEEILELAATLPIQEGGRIKPLDTFAQFTLLKLNGKRFLKTEDGKTLYPIEWLMDCLFYPDYARNLQHFLVNNDEVIEAIGVEAHDKKRSYYSYNELLPGRRILFQEAIRLKDVETKDQLLIEQQTLNLLHNMMQFESLIGALNLARQTFHIDQDSALAAAFPGTGEVSASAALRKMPGIVSALISKRGTIEQEVFIQEAQAVAGLIESLEQVASLGRVLAIVPPTDPARMEWLTFEDTMPSDVSLAPSDPRMLSALEHLEKMAALTGPGDFLAALGKLHKEVKTAAESRGEYGKIPLEAAFYKWKILFYSQWLYVLSFILVAFTWMAPRNKKLGWAAFIAVSVPTVLLVTGITLRCIIRSRPPVSTLYETILFITAVTVIVALALERINRRGVGLAIGSFLGMAGMFLAFRYEVKEGVDTMPSLVAVLDTNFWLATHVTSVTMGYAAGLLSGAIGHIYIFAKLFRFKDRDKSFYKNISRMVYGVLCFGLLFSIVGTILGGIWANESWGRFWGWDPKENGALLICIWGLIVLHARMGGYIKDLGVAICSILMGMVVAFSWWGVNLLGVGLHSYGFISGIWKLLVIFWCAETLVIVVGLGVGLRERESRHAQEGAAPPPGGKQQGA